MSSEAPSEAISGSDGSPLDIPRPQSPLEGNGRPWRWTEEDDERLRDEEQKIDNICKAHQGFHIELERIITELRLACDTLLEYGLLQRHAILKPLEVSLSEWLGLHGRCLKNIQWSLTLTRTFSSCVKNAINSGELARAQEWFNSQVSITDCCIRCLKGIADQYHSIYDSLHGEWVVQGRIAEQLRRHKQLLSDLEQVEAKELEAGSFCPICWYNFEELVSEELRVIIRLPCHYVHIFHLECLIGWMVLCIIEYREITCPIDRIVLAS